jgi:hypothetical protein
MSSSSHTPSQPPIEGFANANDALDLQPITPISSIDLPQTTIVATGQTITVPEYVSAPVPLLVGAFNAFYMGCTCGTSYANNCAHYLSNAFKLQQWPVTFPATAAKCPHGRMIRAKEMLDWFRSTFNPRFSPNHANISNSNGGYWFVYQESGGQGHVCIHKHQGGFGYRGTTDLESWPVQWHYYY